MLDLVVIDGTGRGIVARDLTPARSSRSGGRRGAGHRRVLERLLPEHERERVQRHRHLPGLQARGRVRQPVLHADSPDLHPGRRRPPVEAHADERDPAERRPGVGAEGRRRTSASTRRNPRSRPRLHPGTAVPELRQPRPARTFAAGRRRRCATRPRGRAGGRGVYLDFADAIDRHGKAERAGQKYGNLFDMYQRITAENAYERPMRIYPALHYTMGGLWVDYDLMANMRRAVRGRRGKLHRPRGQPARRSRLSCRGWPTGTSCCRTRWATTSPARKQAAEGPDHPEFKREEAERAGAGQEVLAMNGKRTRPSSSTASWARCCGTTCGMEPHRQSWE